MLLSGWTPRWPRCVAWRVGGHISKRGCGLGWSCCFVSLCFLCIEAAAGDRAIEVHRCCCPGGLLGGLSAGSGGEGWGALVLSIVYALVVQHGKRTSTRHRHHKQPNNEEASHHKEPHHNKPIQLPKLGAEGEYCSHMPPGTSMANITAHALPSGYGEKMKIGHPTNDPRPFLRQTRKTN